MNQESEDDRLSAHEMEVQTSFMRSASPSNISWKIRSSTPLTSPTTTAPLIPPLVSAGHHLLLHPPSCLPYFAMSNPGRTHTPQSASFYLPLVCVCVWKRAEWSENHRWEFRRREICTYHIGTPPLAL